MVEWSDERLQVDSDKKRAFLRLLLGQLEMFGAVVGMVLLVRTSVSPILFPTARIGLSRRDRAP